LRLELECGVATYHGCGHWLKLGCLARKVVGGLIGLYLGNRVWWQLFGLVSSHEDDSLGAISGNEIAQNLKKGAIDL